MRECPRCHAVTFDDMDVCYGCLHRFEPQMLEAREATQLDAVGYPAPSFVDVLPKGSVVSECSNRSKPSAQPNGAEASCGLQMAESAVRVNRAGRAVDLSSLADISELELEEPDNPTPEERELCLCVDDGHGQVLRHRLDAAHPLVVGRSAVCDIELSDPTVSRRHLRVDVDGGEVVVEDLGASNPTYIDGQRLDGRAVLALGALVTIAKARLWAERSAAAR